MRILLIEPKMTSDLVYNKKLSNRFNIYPSLALAQLAGVTPETQKVEAIFEKYQNVDFDWDGDLVGISCLTPVAPRAYEIADRFRKKGTKVILGGWHPTALPGEAKQHADSVVTGEAEIIWPRLLEDLEKNELKPFYKNEKPVDLGCIKSADRKINQGISFTSGIQASRGCPMGCEFCGVTNSPEGRIFRKRPIEKVVEEIKSIRQKHLYFYDPSMTINPDYTKQLFKAMQSLNKKFICFGNIDVLGKDDELLELASRAGCENWFVGFESISQETINKLDKKSNKVEDYASSIKKIHEHGMSVIGAFIFGFDTDTKNVFDNTADMIYDLNIDITELTILTPYPGTPLFDRLDREGRILTKDWSKYTEKNNVVFMPKNMTPEELLDGTLRVKKKVNSISGISKRMLNNKNFSFSNIFGNLFQHF